MMEDRPPLTSPDGSRKRNPPETCPRPLEDLPIPRQDQSGDLGKCNPDIKEEYIEEDEEYGGMEELSEGHKDITMEPPTNRNPPKRCPRPLDSSQEDLPIPRHDQSRKLGSDHNDVKEEYKEEDERYGAMEETSGGDRAMKEPPQRCPRPLDSTQEDLTIPHHDQSGNIVKVAIKEEMKEEDDQYGVMEEFPKERNDLYQENMEESSSYRKPPERCPRPLDSPQEGVTYIQGYQGEDLMDIKVEVKSEDEETYVRDDQEEAGMMRTSIEEDTPTHISTVRGRGVRKISEDGLTSSPEDEDITQYSPGEDHNVHQVPHGVDGPSYSSNAEEPQAGMDGAVLPTHKRFPCPECGKHFHSKSYLTVHKRSHTGEKPYACPECGKSFIRKSVLIEHQRSHTGEKPFVCSVCGKSFARRAVLIEHKRSHTGEKPYSCSECGKSFTQKSYLSIHQRSHTGEKPYFCTECGKSFIQRQHLATHKKAHKREKPYSCPECGKCFVGRQQLITHQRTHTGEKPYSCTECGKCFRLKLSLIKHQRYHTGERPYPCPECKKCFITKSLLNLHQKSHRGEKPHSCLECGKRFSQKSYLYVHQRFHTGEKPYSCTVCGKGFAYKQRLTIHQKCHAAEKVSYSCTVCGKCFATQTSLYTHQKSHRDKKLYTCPECEKCFVRRQHLTRHQLTHTGEKPYSCTKCEKSFSRRSQLVVHERTHTGEKPYSCPECGKCFPQKAELIIHERFHIAERIEPILL